jgi:hypothetical protein
LTQIVKRRFGRRNWPFTVEWDVDGSGQQFYVITEEVATRWHAAAIELDTEQSDVVDDALSDGSSPFTTGEETVVPH